MTTKALFGFTLAEVLITLGIIGIVAAMTIPTLITNNQSKKLKSQFLKSYSTISQAYRLMLENDDSVSNSDYSRSEFYKTFVKHLKVAIDCGNYYSGQNNNPPCYAPNYKDFKYKSLDGTILNNPGERLLDDGTLVLTDGTTLYFENNREQNNRIYISVDLNGIKGKPNIWGYDLFTFQLINDEIIPMGDPKSDFTVEEYCNIKNKSFLNGISCAKKALSESDYFDKIIKNIKK